jgi:Right handed beta helix region
LTAKRAVTSVTFDRERVGDEGRNFVFRHAFVTQANFCDRLKRQLNICLSASAACIALTILALPAGAATLRVGPDQALKMPSAAARVAAAGDTIEIEPKAGGYYDCAVWSADKLTIEGMGGGTILTDTTCQGKAIFVIAGNNITIRNLTFQRARVPDRNGAGIRAEGLNLRIESSRFIDNESGILVVNQPSSEIAVLNSQFIDNGHCEGERCTAGIQTDGLRLLYIESCTFQNELAGDDIRSGAELTELVNNKIDDGAKRANGYLVDLPNGGSLVMRGNQLRRVPASTERNVAVSILSGIGAQPVRELRFIDNRVKNGTGTSLLFVSNWTRMAAEMRGNSYEGEVTPISSSGYYLFMAKSFAHYSLDRTKAFAHYYLDRAKDFARPLRSRLQSYR